MIARLLQTTCIALIVLVMSCQDDSHHKKSITIAVASNFKEAAEAISRAYEAETGRSVILVSGSTGKLSAQIQLGAPFDIFLSADSHAPRHLAEIGYAREDTQFTYALGRLALHSHSPNFVIPQKGFPALDLIQHMAIANPKLAPYGRASRETLEALGHWETLKGKIVRGENIAQTWHFVSSGNAELGLVAASQLLNTENGSTWLVPSNLHAPIEQDAILIHDTLEARQFLSFLKSQASRDLIKSYRYDLPAVNHAE